MSTPQGGDGGKTVYHHEAENRPAHDHHENEVLQEQRVREYWHANLKLLAALLSVWFIVSFGFAILLVDPLNQIQLFGFKLGFWWAQQGAIYVFILLIAIYVVAMKRLDQRYGVDDD